MPGGQWGWRGRGGGAALKPGAGRESRAASEPAEHGGARSAGRQPLGPAARADLARVRAAGRRHPAGEGRAGLPVSAEGGRLGAGPVGARVPGRVRMAEHRGAYFCLQGSVWESGHP